MKKKTLIETNPYLKDPVKRRAAFIKTVISSSAIEGIHVAAADLESAPPRRPTRSGLVDPQRLQNRLAENAFHGLIITFQTRPCCAMEFTGDVDKID
jgi:hypothetical protein